MLVILFIFTKEDKNQMPRVTKDAKEDELNKKKTTSRKTTTSAKKENNKGNNYY